MASDSDLEDDELPHPFARISPEMAVYAKMLMHDHRETHARLDRMISVFGVMQTRIDRLNDMFRELAAGQAQTRQLLDATRVEAQAAQTQWTRWRASVSESESESSGPPTAPSSESRGVESDADSDAESEGGAQSDGDSGNWSQISSNFDDDDELLDPEPGVGEALVAQIPSGAERNQSS